MAKDKKSKNSDIDKLRMILDSPSDPKIKKILEKHEKNLSSIRQRLSSEPTKTKENFTSNEFFKKYEYDSLEPKVTVHEKEEIKPISSEVEQPIEEIEKEIEEVEKDEAKVEDDFQDLFQNEELYEVEKVDVLDHEFLEVKPKDIEKTSEKDQDVLFTQIQTEKEPKEAEFIPEWEPIDSKEEPIIKEFTEIKTIEKEEETQISDDKKEDQTINEFTEVKPIEEKEESKGSSEDTKDTSTIHEFTEIKTIEKEEETQISDDKKEKESEKKFTAVTPLSKEVEPKISDDKSEEEIQTWEPIKLDKGEDSEEISSKNIEEKSFQEVSGKKIKKTVGFSRVLKVKPKFRDKEDRQKRKEERKSQKLEKKRAKIEAKKRDNEIQKSKDEKKRTLYTNEQEQKLKEKEEEKQKKIKAKEEQKHISKLVADDGYQKEVVPRSELKAQKIKPKKEEKEQEVKIKAQQKEDKKLADLREKELKKEEKKQKKEDKLKKTELKTPELISDEDISSTEKVEEAETTEWEAYDAEEVIYNEKKDTSAYYTHGDFTLYKKEIKTVTGKKRIIHFFSKKIPDVGEPVQLPEGYEIKVNKRTNLPYLKKKN